MNFPAHVKQILWDVDTRALKPARHKKFIITRIAEKGAWSDVRWLKKMFGTNAIKKAVVGSRNTSAKTKSFWRLF